MLQRRCILWLLPLLAARALLPAGFMPAVAHGSLALRFCDAGAVTAYESPWATARGTSAAGPAGDHGSLAVHAAHAEDGATHPGSSHTGAECPFAQSAGPLLGTASSAPPPAPAPIAIDTRTALVTLPSLAPLRYAAPRGPPPITATTA